MSSASHVRLLIFVVSTVFLLSCGGSSKDLPEGRAEDITGFRGLEWGSPPLDDMVFCDSTKILALETQTYSRPSDSLTIGGAKITKIQYEYWNNRLCTISILASGRSNFAYMKEAVTTKFGELTRESTDIEKYSKVLSSGDLSIEFHDSENFALLMFYSNAIGAEIKAYVARQEALNKETRDKKAKGDF